MEAAKGGHIKTCALLIKKSIDIDKEKDQEDLITLIEKQDDNGDTALMHAAREGYTETCASLIEKGANIEEENYHDVTALMIAIEDNQKKTAAFLAFATFAPKLFADKKSQDSFYTSFRECIAA